LGTHPILENDLEKLQTCFLEEEEEEEVKEEEDMRRRRKRRRRLYSHKLDPFVSCWH
jgi:hypothetical protein